MPRVPGHPAVRWGVSLLIAAAAASAGYAVGVDPAGVAAAISSTVRVPAMVTATDRTEASGRRLVALPAILLLLPLFIASFFGRRRY